MSIGMSADSRVHRTVAQKTDHQMAVHLAVHWVDPWEHQMVDCWADQKVEMMEPKSAGLRVGKKAEYLVGM
eukprot:scaffold4703_cov273-Ochromonas_danica.AAC.1